MPLSLAPAPRWMPSPRSLSLSFLHPTVALTSSCRFPSLSFLYPLYYLKFPLGCSWHFKPNCLMVYSSDPWPPLLMVPPSFQSLRLETFTFICGLASRSLPSAHIPIHHQVFTLSFPCNSPITFPLCFCSGFSLEQKWCFPSLRHQSTGLYDTAILLCMVFMCLLFFLSVLNCKFLESQNYVFNFKEFEQGNDDEEDEGPSWKNSHTWINRCWMGTKYLLQNI